jgi:hypothetical protein
MPKFYVHYVKFTNREGDQPIVMQRGTLFESNQELKGLWHYAGKTVIAN